MSKYYAIRKGLSGVKIVKSWSECEKLVKGFKGAEFKSFPTIIEANNYITGGIQELKSYIIADNFLSEEKIVCEKTVNQNKKFNKNVYYTDGSFRSGKGGFAVYHPSTDEIVYGPILDKVTSQRAELTAILHAVTWSDPFGCHIYTDSKYAIKTLEEYIPGWKRLFGENPNDWLTTSGSEPANLDLLLAILDYNNYKFTHVPSHTGIECNEIVDHYAKLGRELDKSTHIVLNG